MNSYFHKFVYLLSLIFVLLGTTNCSSTSTGFDLSSFCSTSCSTATASSPTIYISNQGFTIPKALSLLGNCSLSLGVGSGWCGNSLSTATPLTTLIYRQQMQVSGYCSTGGSAVTLISYSVNQTINGLPVPYLSDLYGVPYSNYSTTCDNGRFNLLITPPNDGQNIAASYTGATSAAMQLIVTLQTGASTSALAVASQFATTFYVSY